MNISANSFVSPLYLPDDKREKYLTKIKSVFTVILPHYQKEEVIRQTYFIHFSIEFIINLSNLFWLYRTIFSVSHDMWSFHPKVWVYRNSKICRLKRMPLNIVHLFYHFLLRKPSKDSSKFDDINLLIEPYSTNKYSRNYKQATLVNTGHSLEKDAPKYSSSIL